MAEWLIVRDSAGGRVVSHKFPDPGCGLTVPGHPERIADSQQRREVIGRPASICCQCRAEKPNEIMSSLL